MGGLRAPVAPPPPTRDDFGGGGSEWVTLMRAANDIDAHLVTGRLTEAGIETRMMTDRDASAAWLFGGSNPWAPVNILVRRLQYEDARIVLAEISLALPEAEPPETRADAPPGPALRRLRGPVLWWLIALALAVFFTGISLLNATRDISCANPLCTLVGNR